MCAAAHAWVGLGPIIYASSGAQLQEWLAEWGAVPGPVAQLPISVVAPSVPVRGPFVEFTEQIRDLQYRSFLQRTESSA